MPTFLLIGAENRLPLIEDLAAIAEVDPQDADGVRFLEANAWQSQDLRIETPITRNFECHHGQVSRRRFPHPDHFRSRRTDVNRSH